MPEFLQSDTEELIKSIKRDPLTPMVGRGVHWKPRDLHSLIAIEGNARHANFLLERAVVRTKKNTDSSRLVAAARRSLSLVLTSLTMSDYFSDLQAEYCDMVSETHQILPFWTCTVLT